MTSIADQLRAYRALKAPRRGVASRKTQSGLTWSTARVNGAVRHLSRHDFFIRLMKKWHLAYQAAHRSSEPDILNPAE